MPEYEKAAVLFSGGYDSLLAVTEVAANAGEVHLVTCNTCTTCISKGLERNIGTLKDMFPDVGFVRAFADSSGIQKRIMGDFEEQCEKYEGVWSPLGIWCASCQLAMKGASIVYCADNDIPYCADGAIRAQSYHSASKAAVINMLKPFYAGYGIRYINPVYEVRENTKELLSGKGFDTGMETFGTAYNIQPRCVVAPVIDIWQRTKDSPGVEEKVLEYVGGKVPELGAAVDEALAAEGIDIEGLRQRKIELTGNDMVPGAVPEARAEGGKKNFLLFLLGVLITPFYPMLVSGLKKKVRRGEGQC